MTRYKNLLSTSFSQYSLRTATLVVIGIVLASSVLTLSAHALTTISRGYSASDNLSLGSLVSVERAAADNVVAASTQNIDGLLGVVINAVSSPISLSNGDANQVQVATSGTVPVLVSDINGDITRGDHITASPISGVGMRANGNVRIIGIAQDDLKSGNGSQQTYTDKDGKEKSVYLGEIPVLLNVSYYFKEPDKTIVPAALQNVANALAGKAVSPLPILISAAIFIVMLITVASIVYSMIRSSIISVGRNPMSQSAIYRDMVQLSAIVLVILGVGLLAIYLVLTRI